MTKQQQSEREEARETLRGMVMPGDVVHTILRHISRSGMSGVISVHVIGQAEATWLSGLVERAVGYKMHRHYEGLVVGGCGMDMGFSVVYELSRVLYPDGFGCVGEGCPSNDHSNGDRDYTPEGAADGDGERVRHWHNDGGYALRQRWL